MISCFTAVCAFAQNNIIVTVKLNGNQHREVLIDGTSYYASNYSNTASNNQNTVAVNNLARLSKGKMVGVRYNQDKQWVGGSFCYFEQ